VYFLGFEGKCSEIIRMCKIRQDMKDGGYVIIYTGKRFITFLILLILPDPPNPAIY
jgi:hypothetical protein